MREIDKVLDTNEKVFWEGTPKFWPFLLEGIKTTIVGLIFMAFLIPLLVFPIDKGIPIWEIFLMPIFWLGIFLIFWVPVNKILAYKNIYYTITNKRIIIQKGIIGRDFEYIDFDQITSAEVNVGFWDKVVGANSGSILISSAGIIRHTTRGPQILMPHTLSNVNKPYEVFKFFKKVAHAIKTDIQFPNKYRPNTNPGYKTSFDPNK